MKKKHREKETFSVWQMTAYEWKYGSRESVCQISPGWGDVTLNNSLSYRTRIIETQSVSRVLPSTFSLHRFKRRPKLKWTTFTFISSTFFNELLWAVPFRRTSYYSFVARPNHYQQYSKVHWFSVYAVPLWSWVGILCSIDRQLIKSDLEFSFDSPLLLTTVSREDEEN